MLSLDKETSLKRFDFHNLLKQLLHPTGQTIEDRANKELLNFLPFSFVKIIIIGGMKGKWKLYPDLGISDVDAMVIYDSEGDLNLGKHMRSKAQDVLEEVVSATGLEICSRIQPSQLWVDLAGRDQRLIIRDINSFARHPSLITQPLFNEGIPIELRLSYLKKIITAASVKNIHISELIEIILSAVSAELYPKHAKLKVSGYSDRDILQLESALIQVLRSYQIELEWMLEMIEV